MDSVLDQSAATGRCPTVAAVERHLGILHATFARHYQDLVAAYFQRPSAGTAVRAFGQRDQEHPKCTRRAPAGGRARRGGDMGFADIFVLGLDEQNLKTLRDVPHAEEYRFHPLLSRDELQGGEIPVPELIEKAARKLEEASGRIDAIVGYWDFPVCTITPILCRRFGLASADLEAVVKCEHKYWSRLEQQKVTDAHPRFALLHLDEPVRPPEGLHYPMWIKPVKSYASQLAFRVADDAQFHAAAAEIRAGIGRIGRAFEYILRRLDLPPEIAAAGGGACLVEEALSGAQVTVYYSSRSCDG
jgi:hypothetical protein